MKARAKLDRVVNGSLPDFGDIDNLLYLSVRVKEIFERWKKEKNTDILNSYHSDGDQSRRYSWFTVGRLS